LNNSFLGLFKGLFKEDVKTPYNPLKNKTFEKNCMETLCACMI